MNKRFLCEQLRKTTFWVRSFLDEDDPLNDDNCRIGSGILISPQGHLLTAAHNVTKLPYKVPDLPKVRILAGIEFHTVQTQAIPYRVKAIAAQLELYSGIGTFPVDLAVLEPVVSMTGFPFQLISNTDIEIGTDVLMAGYSDEILSPDQHVYRVDETTQSTDNPYKYRNQLFIKSAMIGTITTFVLSTSKKRVYSSLCK